MWNRQSRSLYIMLSRAHFPSAYKLLCLGGYFSRPDQDDRGKYVRRNFPLRPSFTPSNPPRESQRSWRGAASFAIEWKSCRKEEFEKSFKTLRIKGRILLVKLRRDFSTDFGRKQIGHRRIIELPTAT